jgi:glucose-specific phosphotransferase system IIA component
MSEVVVSPVAGRVVDLGEVDDAVFAERVMGEGAAILPTAGAVVAPVTGTIAKLFPGGHGIALETAAGVQVLVHIGLETVKLKGDGFTVVASEGDEVAAGDALVEVDLARLEELGVDPVTPVVVISGHSVRVVAEGEVATGAPLLEVEVG